MITPEGYALVAQLVAAACLIVALLGLCVRRSRPFVVGSVAAFAALIVAVTVIVELST